VRLAQLQQGNLDEQDSSDDQKKFDVGNRFTHISSKNCSASMVDIGNKVATKRSARARSSVIFPPEIMKAFDNQSYADEGSKKWELIGPKGPIFETAKLAGIMGAK